ncbi:retrovirus-related Pol polyprotein from transposon 412 [Trichonephila clavipes]|uniref:Retrovirus-related Pol polyprotein from transposon 412 n=1 Tax=Trichonephila clavipes TaxID=2585209 RepID=A0A8X6RJB6_TRICX|nr:retrovirus-related Pol polyprotein from transposon 412 [Trichonephila clavipes]
MLFEWDLRLLADLLFSRPPDAPWHLRYIEKLQARMEEMHHLARERIDISSEKMKTRYDARATGHDFHEGDKVWLWNPKRHKGLSKAADKLGSTRHTFAATKPKKNRFWVPQNGSANHGQANRNKTANNGMDLSDRKLGSQSTRCASESLLPLRNRETKTGSQSVAIWEKSFKLSLLSTSVISTLSCQVIYSQFGLAIHQNDHQARHRFVEWAQNEIAVVPDFHKRILFSDEAHFWLNGYVNKQNCRIWSEANPQVYVETPLHPEKLTVWCALWAGGILLQKR